MKIKINFCIIFLLFFTLSGSGSAKNSDEINKKALNFFTDQKIQDKKNYLYNPYENIIAGIAAFTIGNAGYLLSDGPALKVSYTAIQTIGIINLGRGIYLANSPSLDKSFYNLLSDNNSNVFQKDELSGKLLYIFAKEERAKRLSIFYSSTFLALQYILNTTVFDAPDKLKNIYFFLGGVNLFVSAYTALYKQDYEKAYYGDSFDIFPIVNIRSNKTRDIGMAISFSF